MRLRATPYLFILPAFLLVLAVTIFPAFVAVWTSLHDTHYAMIADFKGIANYIEFFKQPEARQNILNSAKYVIGSVGVGYLVGLGLAVFIKQDFPLKGFIETVLLLPWVISQVVAALLISWLINPLYGIIPYILSFLGLGAVDLLSGSMAMPMVVLANVWGSYPLAMILLYAAMQSIPTELYEAAKVDGASPWQAFLRITLPLVRQTSMVTLITLSLEAFNMVTLIYVFTGGGPANRTATLSVRAFRTAFNEWNLGMASTVGVLILLFNLIISVFYIRAMRSKGDYQ